MSDHNMDASFVSEQSGGTSDTKKKKKGLKKLGSGLKNALGGKRRKSRKKRSSGSSVGSQSYDGQSYDYDGDSAYSAQSQDLPLLNADGSANTQAQQEWINGGASGLAEMAAIRGTHNSAGGRGRSLGKIPELPDEDEEGVANVETTRKRGTRRKVKSDASSVSSRDSRRSFFGRKQKAKADPLSLVVLLVEPSSLRFELLSLDFDLKPSRKSRSRSKRLQAELELTVQDVLDQVTPEALTDATLKKKAAAGQCKGLIDRSGAVHFGPVSLEDACAQRPLRALDTALLKQQQNVKLGIPTYGGEPHKDVLLGFFGSDNIANANANANDEGVLSDGTKEEVASALELARPIFSDPNVVGLMEANGFDLKGWKSEPKPKAKLGKPLPAKERAVAKKTSLPFGKLLLGLLAVVLATVFAWSLVAAGLHLLPSIADGDATSPSTLEGHILRAYESAKSWYYNDTGVVSKTKFSF